MGLCPRRVEEEPPLQSAASTKKTRGPRIFDGEATLAPSDFQDVAEVGNLASGDRERTGWAVICFTSHVWGRDPLIPCSLWVRKNCSKAGPASRSAFWARFLLASEKDLAEGDSRCDSVISDQITCTILGQWELLARG